MIFRVVTESFYKDYKEGGKKGFVRVVIESVMSVEMEWLSRV